jgi:4-hydroxybenzoate polyprenyltransferase
MMERSAPGVADAAAGNWVDRLLPEAFRPYARLARLDRPIGWWLLLIPCWWGLALAQLASGGGLPDLFHAALFLIGAIVMRGAGCAFNDIVDRDFDAKVARTRSRPIPSGQVSVAQAVIFMVVLSFIGLAVLVNFNLYTIALAISSLALVALYPFMKRLTDWPQLALSLAFNWGALVGWTALMGGLETAPLLLYAAGIFWTLAYDTIYALQDVEDDALIGVRSTARKFGEASPRWIALFFALAIIVLAAAIFVANGNALAYIGVVAAAGHAAWQLWRLDIHDPRSCLAVFRSNRDFGLIVLTGLVLACLMT